MRFEDERYVRLYTRDSTTWLMLSWQGKCILPLILRKVDRAGILALGEHGAEALSAHLQIPLEVVEPGLTSLLQRGVLLLREGGALVWPRFIEAQECVASGPQRSRDHRARQRDIARAAVLGLSDIVLPETERGVSKAERSVTDPTRNGTERHSVPCRTVPKGEESSVLDFGFDESSPPETRSSTSTAARPELAETLAEAPLPPQSPPTPAPTPVQMSPEREVFEHWLIGWRRVVHGKRKPEFDSKRRTTIRARLANGFTVADLKQACDGMWVTPWNIGENPGGKLYTDVELVCRNASNVERFMAAAEAHEPEPDLPLIRLADRDKDIPKPGTGLVGMSFGGSVAQAEYPSGIRAIAESTAGDLFAKPAEIKPA